MSNSSLMAQLNIKQMIVELRSLENFIGIILTNVFWGMFSSLNFQYLHTYITNLSCLWRLIFCAKLNHSSSSTWAELSLFQLRPPPPTQPPPTLGKVVKLEISAQYAC